jgi:2-C-methyl-D-erythritol 4-phosphate cytidylyltransferase
MRFCAIVAAGGRGERFGQSKQLIDVAGKPMVAWSLATFGEMAELEHVVIATEPEHLRSIALLARAFATRLATQVVASGATRQGSVRNALAAVPAECDAVFIHDGARPLVTPRDIRSGMAAVAAGVGAGLAEPVVDTIKVVDPASRRVTRTLERSELWAAQTPQFATLADLRAGHAAAERDGIDATDDVALLERLGMTVVVIPATTENFKVTLPADRVRAETILRERAANREAVQSR